MEFYGTIGPACGNRERLAGMFYHGMTGVRLNLSHMCLQDAAFWISEVHMAAERVGITPQILIDLQGPELRIGEFKNPKEYVLKAFETIYLGTEQEENQIPVTKKFLDEVFEGQSILLDDGKIMLKVVKKDAERVCCNIVIGGVLKQKKSIALPGVEIAMPTLTQMDIENLHVAKQYGVTGVMLPFVRGREDILDLKAALREADAEDICIFAKIENFSGVDALEEIIEEADTVVIARGDLGNAMPLWELPAVQKKIAKRCQEKGRKFMVVTQMLASMETSAVPTRAEVSDIFNAVLDGADSVMLTGETAAGRYPEDAIRYLVKTVESAEKFLQESIE